MLKCTEYDYGLRAFWHHPHHENESLALSDSDTAHLEFGGQVKEKDYRITILVIEGSAQFSIKQNGEVIYNETVKSIDDLKIFLEEGLYRYFEE